MMIYENKGNAIYSSRTWRPSLRCEFALRLLRRSAATSSPEPRPRHPMANVKRMRGNRTWVVTDPPGAAADPGACLDHQHSIWVVRDDEVGTHRACAEGWNFTLLRVSPFGCMKRDGATTFDPPPHSLHRLWHLVSPTLFAEGLN